MYLFYSTEPRYSRPGTTPIVQPLIIWVLSSSTWPGTILSSLMMAGYIITEPIMAGYDMIIMMPTEAYVLKVYAYIHMYHALHVSSPQRYPDITGCIFSIPAYITVRTYGSLPYILSTLFVLMSFYLWTLHVVLQVLIDSQVQLPHHSRQSNSAVIGEIPSLDLLWSWYAFVIDNMGM